MLQKVKYLFSNLVCQSDKLRLSRFYCLHPEQATQSGHRGNKTRQRIIIFLFLFPVYHAYKNFSLRKRVRKSVRVKGKSLCFQMWAIIAWLQVCDPGYLWLWEGSELRQQNWPGVQGGLPGNIHRHQHHLLVKFNKILATFDKYYF